MSKSLFAALLIPLAPLSAQPDLRATLDQMRARIHADHPNLPEVTLARDEIAIEDARGAVVGQYEVRGLSQEASNTALAGRWRELRAGEYAVPADWSIDGLVLTHYGLSIDAALERIGLPEFVAEAQETIVKETGGGWSRVDERQKENLVTAVRALWESGRSIGLRSADAYWAVMSTLADMTFGRGRDQFFVFWQSPRKDPLEPPKKLELEGSALTVITRQYALLTIDSAPRRGATVKVDGVEWGTTQTGNYVRLGVHRISLDERGYNRREDSFEVTPDPKHNVFKPTLYPIPRKTK